MPSDKKTDVHTTSISRNIMERHKITDANSERRGNRSMCAEQLSIASATHSN